MCSMGLKMATLVAFALSGVSFTLGFRPSVPPPPPARKQQQHASILLMDRSTWCRRVAVAAFSLAPLLLPSRALAVSSDQASDPSIASIQEAADTLQKLLDNWENAVIDCTYADVPRELLETKNKEQLLEKAKVSALFDKSASIVTCKTSNRLVRDYIGATGKGPLVYIDKVLRRGLDLVENSDDMDAYVNLTEEIQQSLAKANSLSYTAGGKFGAKQDGSGASKVSVAVTNPSCICIIFAL